MLVILGIVLAIMVVAGGAFVALRSTTSAAADQLERARVATARASLRTVVAAATVYVVDHPNACPTIEQLVADGVLDRARPHQDPWGGAVEIRCAADDVTATSAGPDRRRNTADDVTVRSGDSR